MGSGNDLAGRRASLSPIKRELLERRLRGKERPAAIHPSVPRTPDGDTAPLSFLQERLWHLQQWYPDTPINNRPTALRLRGKLDSQALERCLAEIVSRHEALRTVFRVRDGTPEQLVLSSGGFALPVEDLTYLPPERREATARALIRRACERTFDLEAGPPLKMRLYRLGPEDHVLLLLTHYIVFDRWSENLVLDELGILYASAVSGEQAALPQPSIGYTDFARRQRLPAHTGRIETQLAYWREQLNGAPAVLDLPTDGPRPLVQTFTGASHSFVIPGELVDQLRELGRQTGATLFMCLLAAFDVLMYRYTEQEDIVVGSPVSGRDIVETERSVGNFVNVLALRGDLSGNPTFRELLSRLRRVCLGAYDHADAPFDQVVREVQPARDSSRTPLFQVMFNLENQPAPSVDIPGMSVEKLELETHSAPYDLTIELDEGAAGLHCVLEFNIDLFDVTTVKRMAGHFHTILEGVATDPDRPIGLLPLLTGTELHQVLVEWNDTARDYPQDSCVHELFEAQVEQRPDDAALIWGEHRLSYRELNERANRLARYLRKLGVGPEVMVGLLVDRSVEMVIGMLGILQAGGAYVPLGPADPHKRLELVLEETCAPVLLTQERLRPPVRGGSMTTVSLDDDWDRIAGEAGWNLQTTTGPTSLVYVIYTSGSTGRPRGVAIPHRAVIRLVCNAGHFELGPGDRVAQISSPSFDTISIEVWGALVNGGTLVGITQETILSPAKLAAEIREQEIDALVPTTAFFNHVAAELPQVLAPLRDLMPGGEAADPAAMRSVLVHGPPQRLLNVYGPTECTTDATSFLVKSVEEGATSIPIGRPVGNTTAYILDSNMQPVPVGIPGELCLGGDGLARGYLNDTELTAEKFVPDPFTAEPDARLFRTGDLARYLPDGNIDLIGRKDQQVKIRGFRIELGEIEAVLGEHPGVRGGVVVAHADQHGDRRLVSYVVSKDEPAPSDVELRRFLARKLPAYMIPSAFVRLDRFPLTAGGKVDRQALPTHTAPRPKPKELLAEPRTPLERRLAEIWTQVLGVEQIGLQDDFFALGGHSLLAIRVIARIRDALQVDVPMRRFFEIPTIAGLADAIGEMETGAVPTAMPELVPLKRPGRSRNAPVSATHSVGEESPTPGAD